MSQFSSPLKLECKEARLFQIGKNALFVKPKSSEKLYIFTDKGKLSFVQATEVRKDEVYGRIVEELSFVNHTISENIEMK